MQLRDLDYLAKGAALLGSGGGGDPRYDLLMTQYAFQEFGPAQMITIDELKDDDFVVPISVMGAPLVSLEKLPSGKEFDAIFDSLPRRPTVLVPAEIGGANAFVPLMVGARLGIPVLDADLIGRAFPELQMTVPAIKGIPAAPAYLSDVWGKCVELKEMNDLQIESAARERCVEMGSIAAVAVYLMTGKQAKEAVVPGSYSHAIELGRNGIRGNVIGKGTILDIDQRVDNGFLKGTVQVGDLTVYYQNEYLMVKKGETCLAKSPVIISIIEEDSGQVIHTESLSFGLRVQVTTLQPPAIWLTKEGLTRCA